MDKLVYRLLKPEIFYPSNGRVIVPYRAKNFGTNVKFEEIYFSEILPNSIKGFKRHKKLFTRLFPISGSCTIGISKKLSVTEFKKIRLSTSKPELLEIAPMHWFFMKNLSKQTCILMNAIESTSDDVENADIEGLNL